MLALRTQLESVCARWSLVGIWAFGSRAPEAAARVAGEPSPAFLSSSDLDLGALPRRGRSLDVQEKVRLTAALEDLFDVPRVDLVVLSEASAFLALEAIRGALLVATDEDRAADFELYVLRRAADLLPYERARRAAALGRSAP